MKIRIWLFDDEKSVLEFLRELFEAFGYEVFCFESPGKILESLNFINSEDQADLIITDIQMPDMDGMEFVEKLNSSGFDKDNIAVISGYWTEEYSAFAQKFGVRMFDKPVDIKELLTWVNERRCCTDSCLCKCLVYEPL
ncbi:response regulator [Desulfonema limicola]|nr:response regulator [Desulfonema limicola]